MNIELRGGALPLIDLGADEGADCFCGCECTPHNWTVTGLGGYVTACRKSAVDAMRDLLSDEQDVEAYLGKLIKRTFCIEMFTASSGWIPCDQVEIAGQIIVPKSLTLRMATELWGKLVEQRNALGLSGDLEGDVRVSDEPIRTFDGERVV